MRDGLKWMGEDYSETQPIGQYDLTTILEMVMQYLYVSSPRQVAPVVTPRPVNPLLSSTPPIDHYKVISNTFRKDHLAQMLLYAPNSKR